MTWYFYEKVNDIKQWVGIAYYSKNIEKLSTTEMYKEKDKEKKKPKKFSIYSCTTVGLSDGKNYSIDFIIHTWMCVRDLRNCCFS